MTEQSRPGPDDPAEPTGAAIARLRHQARLTGQQLGRLVTMSQAKISRIETGQTTASPDDIGRLARALGAPHDVISRLVDR